MREPTRPANCAARVPRPHLPDAQRDAAGGQQCPHDLLYSAEFRDPVSGADYLRARWYLSGHQTFLQRDPFRSLNRYGYANGSPITNYDPSGQSAAKFFDKLGKNFVDSFDSTFTSVFGLRPMFSASYWNNDGYKHLRWWLGTVVTIGQAALMATELGFGGVLGYDAIYTPLIRKAAQRGLALAAIGVVISSAARSGLHGGDKVEVMGKLLGGYTAGLLTGAGTALAGVGLGMAGGLAFDRSPFEFKASDLVEVAVEKASASTNDVDVYLERAVKRDVDRNVGRGDAFAPREPAHAQLMFVGSNFVGRIDYGDTGVGNWRPLSGRYDSSGVRGYSNRLAQMLKRVPSDWYQTANPYPSASSAT